MLTMVKVTVYQGKNFVLTNEHVLRQAAAQPILQTVLVLVPDRFTLQAERILLKQQPHLLNTRVITFSMLYRLVAAELNHGETPAVLDKTSAVMHLWTAIRQVQGELTWFKTSAGHYDFAEKMFNTINQMRSSCVNFTTLEAQAPSAVARKKYHDINLIYQAYRQIIANVTDTSGMLEYLSTHVAASTTVQNAAIFVCGFASLSPARLQVLSALCHTAQAVTIAASEGEFSQQLSPYPHYQIQALPFTPQLTTVRAETERGEATVIVERIVALLEQGVPPEAIVVLLTEFDTLAPVWQVVADKYQLPINLDVGTKLSTTAEAKYLRDLLELAANDDAENTVAVLFNQCSAIDDETAFALENRILQANLRASAVPEIKKLVATKDTVALCTQLKSLTTNEKLQAIFDQIAAGYGTQPFNLRELIALFWTLCSATKISQIPQYIDRVLIAPVNEWVPSRVQYLFIANCTAENFPQGQADDDILQEADLVGTQITPTPALQRLRNYRHAELLQTVATAQVTLSGTREDFQVVPYTPYYSFRWYDDQTPLTVGSALFFPQQHVKTTLLERYYTCPRLNFIQNGLGLAPRPLYRLQANTVGSAIHAALQDYFTNHNMEKAVAVGVSALAYDYPPLTKNIAKEIRFILQQLAKIFATGKFQYQTVVEKAIKRPLAHGLTLVGRVDRVDVADLGDHRRAIWVLDYKTGNVSGSIPKSIYLGNKLQLPVYASILSAEMGTIAGAGYLPLSSGYATDQKKFLLKGFLDRDYQDLFPSAILSERARYYVTADVIHHICQHANRLVDAAVEKLMAGDVVAHAVEKAVCKYCPVRLLCTRAETDCRGEGVEVSFKTFEEVPS
ncbi:MAG: PD-(D/E)XK nuclease family protein [Prevotella sp.]|nr:PD-(D/E)XK nuclease family protein [Prevotella sp.]